MNKKINMGAIKKCLGKQESENGSIVFGSEDKTIEIAIKKSLSLKERKEFVSGVVDMCFMSIGNGEVIYCPYLKNFAFDYHTALFFTNIELAENVEETNRFLIESRLLDKISKFVGEEYINELRAEADELIGFRKQEIVKRRKIDVLLDSLLDVISTFNKKLEGENGEAIIKYLEENIPNFKEEITKAIQDEKEKTITE